MIEHSIGASDVGAILGLSKWATPAAAWARLTGLTPGSGSTNATERGHLLERAILWDVADREGVPFDTDPTCIDALALITDAGRRVSVTSALYRGPEYRADRGDSDRMLVTDWACARPDGYLIAGFLLVGRTIRLVEVKTTRDWNDWTSADGREILPPGYYAQVQWQMLVTGVTHTIVEAFCVFDDARRTIQVPFNPAIAGRIFDKVDAWRTKHLVNGELPENITADIAGLIWPAVQEPEVWLDASIETMELGYAYAHHRRREKTHKLAAEAARDRLVNIIRDATGITAVASWKGAKNGKRAFRCLLKGAENE